MVGTSDVNSDGIPTNDARRKLKCEFRTHSLRNLLAWWPLHRVACPVSRFLHCYNAGLTILQVDAVKDQQPQRLAGNEPADDACSLRHSIRIYCLEATRSLRLMPKRLSCCRVCLTNLQDDVISEVHRDEHDDGRAKDRMGDMEECQFSE